MHGALLKNVAEATERIPLIALHFHCEGTVGF